MFRDDTILRAGGNVAKLRILLLVAYLFPIQTFAQSAGDQAAKEAEDKTFAARAASRKTKSATIKADLNTANAVAPGSAKTAIPTEAGAIAAMEKCETARKAAHYGCAEFLSGDIAGFLKENGDLLQMGLLAGSSIGDQCSGLGDLLSKGSIALGAFTATCKAAQVTCKSTCATATKNITYFEKGLTEGMNLALSLQATYPQAAQAVGIYKSNLADVQSAKTEIAETVSFCAKHELTTQSAVMGAIGALKGMMQAKSCEEKNTDGAVAGLDCTKDSSPNYATPSCQCFRGEKTAAECQGININASNINPGGISLPKISGDADGSTSVGGPMDLGGNDDGTLGKIDPSMNGAAPPVGGGGGGAMGGGGSGGGSGQDGAYAQKRLNTNILGGGFGGGGGGGSGGGGPGYEMDDKLKDYMPGQKNDPNRSLASQLAKEVTPQAGRSNWEKVRLRYRDNYSSLLNK